MASPTQQQQQQPKQRIFITGATGYIGTQVTTLALRAGYAVHGLSRSSVGSAKLLALGATPVEGTLTSLATLRAEASAADAVIHLADAWIDDFAQPYDGVVAVDNAAVEAMVSGLRSSSSKSGKGRRGKLFIGTSGAGVVEPFWDEENGDWGETDEKAPENKNPMNGRIRCEKFALGMAVAGRMGGRGTGKESGDEGGDEGGNEDGGVHVCIMRLPPFVYGRGGSGVRLFMGVFAKLGFVARVVPTASGPAQANTEDAKDTAKNVATKDAKTCVVHVDDAARAYILALEHACRSYPEEEEVVADIFNVTASTEVTFRELTDAMAATMGLPVREMGRDEAARTAGPLIAGFFSDRIRAASGKARRELGWVPREVGIVEDIRNGSYVEVARELMMMSGGGGSAGDGA